MYVSRRRSLLFRRRSLLFWRRSLLFWRRSLLFQGATRFYSGDTDFNNITVITPSTILNTAALMYVCLPDPLLGICTCMCPGAARYYFGAARYYSGAARYYSGAARYYSGAARYYGSRRCRLLKSRLRRTCSSPSASALSLPCKNGT